MVIASSISGLPIYAPSAGFAPTNSADVSAIASAYQVVSATATQLYAGTAYVTSVNDAPISASRAGNAANASLANSAWYDGTGRLISALPDSAAVSAIASSYAESAASGKQDELTFSYDDDKISAINGSALAGQGGGGEQVVTSLQYAVSEPTAECVVYQPAGTIGGYLSSNLLALEDHVYGIELYNNLSGLYSFDVFMTGLDSNILNQYNSAYVSALVVKASASGRNSWEWSPSDTAFGGSLASLQTGFGPSGSIGSARVSTVGLRQYGTSWPDGTPFSSQPPCIFFTTSDPYQGTAIIGTAYGSASYVNTAAEGESSVSGVNELPLYVEKDTSVSAIAEAYAQSAAQSAVSSVSGDYYPRYSNPSDFVPSSAAVMRSSVGYSDNFITSISGTPLMATDSALAMGSVSDTASAAAYQTAIVDFGADAVSRSVFVRQTDYSTPYITAWDSYGGYVDAGSIELAWNQSGNDYTGLYVVTSTAAVSASIFSYQTLSASAICGYTIPLAHASALPTYQYNTADQISSINGSALGGMDEAAVSGIASAYAESAVSGKADSSALSSYVPYSSIGYNTASAISGINGSALAAGSTYSAGEGIDITDDVISVEAPVDVVAGPGITIDNPDGNTMRISCDSAYATVLYSGANVTSATLSDNVMNYEFVDFYLSDDTNQTLYLRMDTTRDPLRVGGWGGFGGVLNTSSNWFGIRFGVVSASANSAYSLPTDQMSIFMSGGFRYSGQSTYYSIFKVYGINRTASAQ